MVSYLKKYATAFLSAKNYIAQWSAERVYADEALIVPFPTLAIYDPDKDGWLIDIKAWLYLPFEGEKIKSYLPFDTKKVKHYLLSKSKTIKSHLVSESKIIRSYLSFEGETDRIKTEEWISEERICTGAVAIEDDKKQEDELIDEDIFQDDLKDESDVSNQHPGRLGLFFVENSAKVATKAIINGVEYLLQPTDESGFIDEQLELPDHEIKSHCTTIYPGSNDRKLEYDIQLNQSKTDVHHDKPFKCTIYVLASYGVSIISDIDDTIKISQVLNKPSLLKNTFYSYFKPVDGMNELYQKWSEQNCQFHYVSASPWQLYPALRCFLEQYKFPMGTVNLRKFSWSFKFLKPPDTYKIGTITPIINSYPLRKYICVGDSGELDPEIYSKLYTIYPENIAHIFIRDLCPLPNCSPTCHERYKRAFKDVPRDRWTIFKDPREIQTNIEYLIGI